MIGWLRKLAFIPITQVKGLNVAEKHVDFFGRDPEIDRLLVNKYEFCSTGMTHPGQL